MISCTMKILIRHYFIVLLQIATHPGEKVDESNQGVSLRVQSTSIEYDKDVTEEELKKVRFIVTITNRCIE